MCMCDLHAHVNMHVLRVHVLHVHYAMHMCMNTNVRGVCTRMYIRYTSFVRRYAYECTGCIRVHTMHALRYTRDVRMYAYV